MPFNLNSYENAKEKAKKRLSEWIDDAKEEKKGQSGIARLQKVHKDVFKRIEWKPKDGNKQMVEEDQHQQSECKPRDVVEEGEKMTPCLPSIHLEDHVIHDSNSSNVSSRLQSRRDDINYSENKTPLPRSPFSRAGFLDKLDTIEKSQPKRVLKENELKPPENKHNLVLSVQFPGRRKRKKQHRKKDEHVVVPTITTVTDELPQQTDATGIPKQQDMTVGILEPTQNKLSIGSSVLTLLKKKSSMTFGGMLQTVKPSAKGVVESILKRAVKSNKHSRIRHEVGQTSMRDGDVEEEISSEEQRKEILDRFRRVVKLLIHVRVLLNVSMIRIQEEEKSKEFKRVDGGMELSFDPNMFKTALSYGGLNSTARKALKKKHNDRSEVDIRMLMEIMVRMRVFIKYPKSVRQDLIRVMWYDNFKNGRVIVKQGDPGSRMYFVLSGEVDLKRTEIIHTGEQITTHLNTITSGYTFGELSLIRDMKREYTAVCKGNTEVLSWSKGEFNQVLRDRWEAECNLRFNFLRTNEHFLTWTDKQLQRCADSSILKDYPDNKVILGDKVGQPESVYFIRKGRCDVVRRILAVRQASPYRRPNLLLPENACSSRVFLDKKYARNRRFRRHETHFLTVTTLHPGSYFGAGESLRDTFILSRGKTECIQINCVQYNIQGKSEQLRYLKRERENALPANKTLYTKFQQNRRWYEYKNKLVNDIMKRKESRKVVCTLEDVPQTIKREPAIPRDLIYYK